MTGRLVGKEFCGPSPILPVELGLNCILSPIYPKIFFGTLFNFQDDSKIRSLRIADDGSWFDRRRRCSGVVSLQASLTKLLNQIHKTSLNYTRDAKCMWSQVSILGWFSPPFQCAVLNLSVPRFIRPWVVTWYPIVSQKPGSRCNYLFKDECSNWQPWTSLHLCIR